jgi:hypothetical protein
MVMIEGKMRSILESTGRWNQDLIFINIRNTCNKVMDGLFLYEFGAILPQNVIFYNGFDHILILPAYNKKVPGGIKRCMIFCY